MSIIDQDRLAACKIVRDAMNTHHRHCDSWMLEFEKLAHINRRPTLEEKLANENLQYLKRLVGHLREGGPVADAAALMKEAADIIEDLTQRNAQ
jgi:hypothetical protein